MVLKRLGGLAGSPIQAGIQFGLGFSTAELTLDGKSILSLDVAEADSPVLELVVGPVTDPVEAPKIGSVFEKGSSSGIPFTSKNQKKNYLRRVRRKIAKSRKIVEVKTLAQVDPESVEDLPIPASSPLLQGSRFHPLAAASGEERVSRIATERRLEVKGKRAKSPEKKYVPKKISRVNIPLPVVKSIHSQAELPQASASATKTPVGLIVRSDTSVMDPPDTSVDSSKFLPATPGLLVRVSEDSTLPDVGVSTLQTPAPSFELIAEPPTANELKLQAIISSLQQDELYDMVEYKGYLPISPKEIGNRPVDEVVQEIKDILKRKEDEEVFDPELDDMLIDEDLPISDVYMVETRGSVKETEPSKRQSGKEEGSAAVDSDSDESVRARDEQHIKNLEAQVAEMLLQVKKMQQRLDKSHETSLELQKSALEATDRAKKGRSQL
ncbi:hypothetical protein IEQ34_000388 [Dendrobium chrysotoxum]|uniref:Uncharacterized protein n=1 Tax=Dendrobium chrysotoxum TaxID=161865 RepID=A0AAV7HR67_DENCH|nr:hypothetical protein IEQ34_000388 [Dendrobium chrysotoxum]